MLARKLCSLGYKSLAADDSSWSNNAHDVPFDQALRLAGIFELLSNRHLETLLYKTINIALSAVDRNTAHRYGVICCLFRAVRAIFSALDATTASS